MYTYSTILKSLTSLHSRKRLALNQETTLQNSLHVKLYIVIKPLTKNFIRWKLESSGKYSYLLKYLKIQNYVNNMYPCGAGSSVGIVTAYGLDGPRIESRWGEIFRTSPDRAWGPPSLLYNGYRVFPGGKVLPGHKADPSPSPSAEV